MKKTLIALAVVASAVVSGSSMAAGWVSSGNGGTVNIGGTLTPAEKTPWVVWLGNGTQNLNSPIFKGESTVNINVSTAIPVLGIRTLTQDLFQGGPGLSPQIDYGQAVDTDGFNNGITTLTLDIKDKTGNTKIGSVSVPFAAAAVSSWENTTNSNKGNRALFAATAGDGFFGGLGKADDKVATAANAVNLIASLSPDFAANYNDLGVKIASYAQAEKFAAQGLKFSAYYGSGIQAGSTAKITLDAPAGADNIEWTAALPVVVSYQ